MITFIKLIGICTTITLWRNFNPNEIFMPISLDEGVCYVVAIFLFDVSFDVAGAYDRVSKEFVLQSGCKTSC